MSEAIEADVRYRAIAAQAWSGMLMVLTIGLVTDLLEHLLKNSYEQLTESLRSAAGLRGLWFLAFLACLSSLIQVGIRTFDSPTFRRFVFCVSVLYIAVLLLYTTIDTILSPHLDFHTVLSLTHIVLGIWACWASARWSGLAQAEAPQHSADSREDEIQSIL
jgi:hypothetical protein